MRVTQSENAFFLHTALLLAINAMVTDRMVKYM